MEECKTDQLQMYKELSYRGKPGCSVLDVHNNQPEIKYEILSYMGTIK